MAGQDSYGQGVVIASLTDAPDAETLAKNIANALVERSVMRFDSASARAATLTSPVEGMVTWLRDANLLYHYTGTSWIPESTVLMTWTSLASASLGSFSSGFSASTPPPRMRKIVQQGTEVWEYEGAINVNTLPSATTVTAYTFTSSYRPSNGRGFVVYNSSHYGARLTIGADGKLNLSVPSEAGSNVAKVWLDGIRITNPAA